VADLTLTNSNRHIAVPSWSSGEVNFRKKNSVLHTTLRLLLHIGIPFVAKTLTQCYNDWCLYAKVLFLGRDF
jgi:hypothetical protein